MVYPPLKNINQNFSPVNLVVVSKNTNFANSLCKLQKKVIIK